MRAGVPQGSILGPVLFNLYINDMPKTPNTDLYLYADDTSITAQSGKPNLIRNRLQMALNNLQPWLTKWRIKVNNRKSQAIIFTKRRNHRFPAHALQPLQLFGKEITWSNQVVYLGVTMDQGLTWNAHLLNTRHKAQAQLRKLYPLLNLNSALSYKIGLMLYKTLIRPILTYASPVWGYAAPTHIKTLNQLQNKILRIITKVPYYAPARKLHEELKMHTIEEFIKKLASDLYDTCKRHHNSLVTQLGNYDTDNKHKRPLHIFDRSITNATSAIDISVYLYHLLTPT